MIPNFELYLPDYFYIDLLNSVNETLNLEVIFLHLKGKYFFPTFIEKPFFSLPSNDVFLSQFPV